MLGSPRENFVQNDTRLFTSAYGGEHRRSLYLRRWSVACKDPFLFERRECFVVHALFLIGPTQHGMRGNGSRIQLQCFTTLLDGLVVPARQKQHVGDRGG